MYLTCFLKPVKKTVLLFLLFYSTGIFGYNSFPDSVVYYMDLARKRLPEADSLTLHYAEMANGLALETQSDSLITLSYYTRGMVYYYKGYFKASNEYYHRALQTTYAEQNPSFQSKLLNNIGVNYDVLTEFDKALDNYIRSLDIEKELENKPGVAQTNINIGLVYIWEKNFEQAFRYLNEARTYFEAHPDSFSLGLIYQNLMLHEYHTQEHFDPQPILSLAFKAEKCFEQIGNWNGLVEVYYNMSRVYQLEEDETNVLAWLNKALEVAREHELYSSETVLRIKLARIKLMDTGKAHQEKVLLEGLEIIRENGIRSMEDTYYTELLQFYALTGETTKLFEVLEQFTKAINIHRTTTRMETFEELSFMHDLKNKENLIEIQQLRIARQESRQFILVLAILLFIFIGGGLMFFYRYRLRKLRDLYYLNKKVSPSGGLLMVEAVAPESSLREERDALNLLYERILDLLKEEKLFVRFEVSVAMLADRLNTNEKYISTAINRGSGMNFYHFINTWRINEAKDILQKDTQNSLTLEQVMYQVGFRSRTTFTAAFKKMTGLTPGQFRKLAREEKAVS